jgi:hypothetical protein
MESVISPFHLFGSDTWYTSPEALLQTEEAHRLASADLPEGWRRQPDGIWVHLSCDGARLPQQGWKIHVSCTPHAYTRTVDTVWDVCRRLGLHWKFIGHPRLHQWCNGKGAERSFSGKAIAVYPADEQALRTALDDLAERLEGAKGPYILSDLRWKDTTAYVRYGAFTEMWCDDERGRSVPALLRPDGRLEPDVRGPVFTPPTWLAVPEWLAEGTAFAKRTGRTEPKRPTLNGYTVKRALHFSNAGGVYLAEDPRGRTAVLKEARPFAGIDATGRDAVERLRHEHDVLRALAGRPWAPEVYDTFAAWEHHYLAIEFIEGDSLQRIASRELPLIQPGATPRRLRDYYRRMQPLFERLEQIITELHDLGYAFGDLHTQNVIISPDRTGVRLIDFESVTRLGSDGQEAGLLTPGFAARIPMKDEAADWYAFASCQLAALAPYNFLAHLNEAALQEGVAILAERYGLPPDNVALIRSRLGIDTADPRAANTANDRERLVEGILAAADPEDDRRLYPADPGSLERSGAIGLAHGASGVLLALSCAGAAVPPDHRAWLERAAATAPENASTGLYDGLAGAAFALHRLEAPSYLDLVDRIEAAPAPDRLDLHSGRAGIAFLHLEIGDHQRAVDLAESLHKDLDRGAVLHAPGILHGYCGIAMLFASLARRTGDDIWTGRHLAMIDKATADAEIGDDGLLLRSGRKLLPYLGQGSAGLALALLSGDAWLTERHRGLLTESLRAMDVEFTVEAGLFRGRLGIAYVFAQAGRFLPEFAEKARLVRSRIHPYIGRTASMRADALIGRESHRFSLDLATGSAGAVFVDGAIAAPETCQLPGMELAARP